MAHCKDCGNHTCKRCGRERNPVDALMGPVCLPCTREIHKQATR